MKPVAGVEALDRGFEAPVLGVALPPCQTRQPWRWQPYAPGAIVSVYGLPGALVEQGEVLWTPPHAGRYSLIVTATSATGWAQLSTQLLCTASD